MQVRPWTATDRTGRPLDAVLDELRKLLPELIVERAKPAHHNVYFLRRDAGSWRLRIDDCRDHLARGDEQVSTSDPAEAARAVCGWLGG
jgi:hypothetical protein